MMNVHLIDGAYELFRHYYAIPQTQDGAAVRGVLASILSLIESGATHVAVATDHVVESFRNDLYAGYKTGEGIPPVLYAQFPLLEEALDAMGVLVWPMVEFEADDGLASAAAKAAADPAVAQVLICTPDKDLAQCVMGSRVVQVDRRRGIVRDEAGVREKWGVAPGSIPDYLAVVGDNADGYPGISGWGAKAAGAVFGRYPHVEDVPRQWREWDVPVRGAGRLAASLFDRWEEALLYRKLATLRLDAPVFEHVDEARWRGPHAGFRAFSERIGAAALARRAEAAGDATL
jgi:5'-3' exonuclease